MSDLDADRYAWIRERIARVPRIRLALTPTPLEEAANLSRALEELAREQLLWNP